ncbi:metal-dependent hydrolase family protein [Acuticoccus kandeliae]|uniref:metal-dependent hydrolase family protein n=1 Tax=Acuticoccus kandeliae TaxID=2073160 RepID=UPI000D3E02F2|nr:amidohydrolase family protein [Acuticoccus kandeliae]
MNEFVFENLRLLDPEAGRLVAGMKVWVRGDRIVAVGHDVEPPPGVARVDLGDRVLMPGLIDCHIHIMSIKTKWANNTLMHMPASLANAGAAVKLKTLLMRGYTTVRDAAGADRGHREAVESGQLLGPRLFVSGRAVSQTGGHGDARTMVDHAFPCACQHLAVGTTGGISRIADGVDQVRRAVRDEIRLGADAIKIFVSGGVGSDADPIHFMQFSPEEIRAVVEECENADTYALAHAYTADTIYRAVENGVRSIEHGNFLDDRAAELMVEKGTYFVPTLVAYEATMKFGREQGYPERNFLKNERVLAVGTKSLEVARKAGVKMAFGTDLIGELDDHQSEEFEIRSRVLPNADIIRSATLVGAEVVRRVGEIGVIAKGAYADMILLDKDPLEDISVLASGGKDIRMIMKGGIAHKDELSLFPAEAVMA